MSSFAKAPVISRESPRGMWAEGIVPSEKARELFEYAVSSFGFIVPVNRRMTGGQWVAAIARSHDISQLRVLDVVNCIKKVMCVDQFADESVLIDKTGVSAGGAVFRGSKEKCQEFAESHGLKDFGIHLVSECAPDVVAAADLSMNLRYLSESLPGGEVRFLPSLQERVEVTSTGRGHPLSEIGLPPGYFYMPRESGTRDVFSRALGLLRAPAVGPQKFDQEQMTDRQATLALMAVLTRIQGYGALVTSGKLKSPRQASSSSASEILDHGSITSQVRQIENSMHMLLGDLLDSGWDESKDFFITRPAPAFNPLMSMRPYESMVHLNLIGWRLPRGVVQGMCEEIRELEAQRDSVRQHGERAA